MKKVILSRKGFDSSSGGYPSPILPDGTLVSLPIPDENTSIYYKDLMVNKDLSYLELMEQLGIKNLKNGNQKIGLGDNPIAHLDPDINKNIIARPEGWKAIFGQSEAAAGQLDNNKIDEGAIFLFFGWFRKAIEKNGKYMFDPDDKQGRHIIWGYLEVGEKIKIDNNADYPHAYLQHPHFEDRNKANNTAYIARDFLSFDNSISGAGVFTYNDNLVLTKELGNKNKKRSLWQLPSFFHPNCGTIMTYHEDKEDKAQWKSDGDYCTLQTVGRGQEFVLSGNDEIYEWAKSVILGNYIKANVQTIEKCNHLNYPDEEGRIYCRKLNTVTVLNFKKLPCGNGKNCSFLSGSLQGEGVECLYEDENAEDSFERIYNPYKQYYKMNKK